MTTQRNTERNDQHVRENLIDPGPLAKVNEREAEKAREALRQSTPGKIR